MTIAIALTGALQRASIPFANVQEVNVQLLGNGPMGPNDYTVGGVPIVAELNTVTIAVAAVQTYSVVIRGRTYSHLAGALESAGDIRDALKTLVDADAAALGIVTANVGGTAFSVASLVPGVRLAMSVTASVTPANITLALGLATAAVLPFAIVAKEAGRFLVRATAAITANLELLISG